MRDAVVAEALSWVGVRWKHQGRSRDGVDCVGLVVVVARPLDLIPDSGPVSYPRRPDGSFLDHFRTRSLELPSRRQALPGDVLVFAEEGLQCHCGIVAPFHGVPGVVHGHARRRKVVHEALDQAVSVVGRPTHAFRFVALTGD